MDYSKDPVLKLPSSMAVRMQVMEILSASPTIAGAAALGVCWRGAGAPGVRFRPGKASEYGAGVIDYFTERGMSLQRLNELSVQAISTIVAGIPSGVEEEDALENSEAPEGSEST